MTAWTDFLKKHSGQGHSMSELSTMYNKSCKAPKKSSKKASSKATVKKASSKATVKKASSKATAKKASSKATAKKASSKATSKKASSKATVKKASSKATVKKASSKATAKKASKKPAAKKSSKKPAAKKSSKKASCKVPKKYSGMNGPIQLMNAIENQDIGKVRSLIKTVDDINWQNVDGNTALIIASKYGTAAIIKLLIDAGADLDIQNAKGNTALIIASKHSTAATVKLLIDAGADLDLRNVKGATALSSAATAKHINKIAREHKGVTAVYDVNIIKLLLNAGADIHHPPVLIMLLDDISFLKTLIAAGADLTIRTYEDLTPLMVAAYLQLYKSVKILLEAGADPSATTSDGYTAADFGGKRIKKLILSYSEPIEHA